ncbi:UNVERIFIED_CONTAM: Beta-D-glucosyl crocetin beta-1,6-glucosyltransferase [Sesamum latifolium]|uniref:Beta-D-glucosyl crocetin beta-1,6-glucosyltransferase n=1 Tax=Sesamum latifolium TaxID=2727402 RepID=A0AAW2XDI0_9LAMI
MDYLSEMLNKEFVPAGSLVLDHGDDDADEAVLMDWLSQKDKFSCVFVSFGTEYFLKREEIEEVAHGLELSNVNFIWIVRFPKGDGTTVAETLPAGFLERVGGRGRIVEKWASQAKILTHPSVGGFVSHCGWNSLTESIEFGVPIIAMPMHLDQPMNAKLVAELGVGVEVKRDNEGRLQRDEIAKVIRDVVVGESGEELRRQVIVQRERIRLRRREEMDEIAHKLAKICGH